MAKSNNFDSALIKRRALILQLKKAGINRANQSALREVNIAVNSYLEKLYSVSKEEMLINGRKTLKDKDIINAVKKIENKGIEKQENSWET